MVYLLLMLPQMQLIELQPVQFVRLVEQLVQFVVPVVFVELLLNREKVMTTN